MATADSKSFNVRINVPTQLAKAAAVMPAGSWAVFACNFPVGQDLNYMLDSGGGGIITGYADKMAWDSAVWKIYFTGKQHPSGSDVVRTIEYDDATNTWTRIGDAPWSPRFHHAYGGNTCAPGKHFVIQYGTNIVWERDVAQGNSGWSQISSTNLPSNFSAANGLEFFPTWTGGISGGSLITVKGDRSGVWRHDGSKWTNISSVTMGDYENFAVYTPVRDIMYFGGGVGSTAVYILSNTGSIRSGLAPCPHELSINSAIIFTDPVSGNLMALGDDKILRVYNPDTGTSGAWTTDTELPDSNFWTTSFAEGPCMAIVAASIPAYQVTMFITPHTPSIYLRKGR
jgi:hypothetical protein